MTATTRLLPTLLCLLLLGGLSAGPARAAESYDACTGFIDSIPATITTQGVWCLRKDLATAITNGAAITIATNNVTIDCNGFKLGGLAAGNASHARGIRAENRQNATVRNCSIRGFYYGIDIYRGAGHLIEDNRLDNNLVYAIIVLPAENSLVQRNRIYDTGGAPLATQVAGIHAFADVIDNTVSGLFAADATAQLLAGIASSTPGARIHGNTISGFDMTATNGGTVGNAYGIYLAAPGARVSGNHVSGNGGTAGNGIRAASTADYCLDNTIGGFAINIHPDCNSSGNLTSP